MVRGVELHLRRLGRSLDDTLGEQLGLQKTEHERADPRPYWIRRVDAVRNSARGFVRKERTGTRPTMLGYDERPRLGTIEHLPGAAPTRGVVSGPCRTWSRAHGHD